MSDLLELVSLQAIDDALDADRAELAAAEHQLASDDRVARADAALAEADALVADLQKRQRASDAAVQDLDDRIAREEKKLYDGSIKQFKELQALEGDIAHLKTERRGLEDAALEILTGLDEALAARTVAASEREAVAAAWAEESAGLETRASALRRRVATGEAAREKQVGAITAGSVRLYEGLRKRKGGQAVVRVNGSSCGGCRVAIPDPVRRRIISSPALVQCPHCERILAVG